MSYSSVISKYKIGDCSHEGCGLKQTEGKKRGKLFLCLHHCKMQDVKKQMSKQRQRGKLGKLLREQVQSGDHEGASRQALIQDLDYVVSRIVRLRAANDKGFITCYCGAVVHWSMAQNSHFIPRSHMGLRWSFDNCASGCKHCNIDLHGNLDVFEASLEAQQDGLPDQLRELSTQTEKWGLNDLKMLLVDLRGKLRPLEEKVKKLDKPSLQHIPFKSLT